jgi:predicted lipoprotein with Yx(FWY)xxD motif
MMMKRTLVLVAVLALVSAACGGDDAADDTTTTTTTATTTTTTASTTTTTAVSGPAMAPAEVVFDAQESDGTSIVVSSVTLPSPGFIAVHANADGGPGPIVGHSDLLPEGTSTDVTVDLDTPLEETDLLFPMAHIDVNGNGEYEFTPPDVTVDAPAMTAAGEVAVVGAEVTVAAMDAAATVEVATTELGDILVDGDGRTLYLFLNDDQGPSTCYDDCAANWPPLTTDATAGDGVDTGLLGTAARDDGTEQVTYDGWPLYHFVADTAPGDVNGQGVIDRWFVVSPEGEPVQ